jgi:glucose-6-phosphate-specific signal transduction histidine kinase
MRAVPQVKCLHVIAASSFSERRTLYRRKWGLAAVVGAGILNATLDHFDRGDESIWDVFATVTGGLPGLRCGSR